MSVILSEALRNSPVFLQIMSRYSSSVTALLEVNSYIYIYFFTFIDLHLMHFVYTVNVYII